MSWRSSNQWRPYVPVAERHQQAAQRVAKMKKTGRIVTPVIIAGRKIATTFWGEAWCNNLESYSDFANRLPRGRSYVRNGSVVDLQITSGRIQAMVSGSDIYEIDIKIAPLAKERWTDIKRQCAGQIGSLVELLRGSISKSVMEIVTHKGNGLFPAPSEIKLSCSCPDWATMCKHVAASLYGVGARLDHEPTLLFALRGVDPTELIEAAIDRAPAAGESDLARRVLATDDLASVFGVDIDTGGEVDQHTGKRSTAKTRAAKEETATKKDATKTARAGKTAVEKSVTKKTAAKKAPAEKAAGGKTAAKKAAAKKTARKKPRAKTATARQQTKSTKSTAAIGRTATAKKISARTLKPAAKPEAKPATKPEAKPEARKSRKQ